MTSIARAATTSLLHRAGAPDAMLQRKARKRELWARIPAYVGAALLFAIIAAAFLSPWISPYSPTHIDVLHILQGPSWSHIMGTDEAGRDVFSRVLHGLRLDILLIAAMTYGSVLVGTSIGAIAGFFGSIVDGVLGRVIDTVMAFPFLVLVLGIVAISGPGVRGVVIGGMFVGWAVYARLTRAEMLAVRERQYVAAARTLGYSTPRILFKHAIPNVLRPAGIFSMSDLVLNLMLVATLSYLGLGVQPPRPELGAMIAAGQTYLFSAWWITTLPGVVLVLLGISFSLIGDGLADRAGTQQVVRL